MSRRPHFTKKVMRGLAVLAAKPPLIDSRKTSDEGAALRWIIRTQAFREMREAEKKATRS